MNDGFLHIVGSWERLRTYSEVVQAWQWGPPWEKCIVAWEVLRTQWPQPAGCFSALLLWWVTGLGGQRRGCLRVASQMKWCWRERFVKLEDACCTVKPRRGGGWRKCQRGARSTEGWVGWPALLKERRARAGLWHGGWGRISIKRWRDNILHRVFWWPLLQRDLRVWKAVVSADRRQIKVDLY